MNFLLFLRPEEEAECDGSADGDTHAEAGDLDL